MTKNIARGQVWRDKDRVEYIVKSVRLARGNVQVIGFESRDPRRLFSLTREEFIQEYTPVAKAR